MRTQNKNYNMKYIHGRVPAVLINSKLYFVTSAIIPKGTQIIELQNWPIKLFFSNFGSKHLLRVILEYV